MFDAKRSSQYLYTYFYSLKMISIFINNMKRFTLDKKNV